MSLKLNDWKAVLNQPKNLGLKAGSGTGMSAALEKAEKAETAFEGHKSAATLEAYIHALDELKALSDKTIGKHKAVFTTACAYLKTVSDMATARVSPLKHELPHRKEYEKEAADSAIAKTALKSFCLQHRSLVRDQEHLEQLSTFWAAYARGLQKKVLDYEEAIHSARDGLQIQVRKIEALKLAPTSDAKADFLLLRGKCMALAQKMEEMADGPSMPAFNWNV